MKTILGFIILCIGCLFIAHYAGAFQARASVTVEKRPNVPAVDVGFHVELPASTPALKRPQAEPTKKAKVAAVARAPKQWVCSDWRELTQGHGRVQPCEWR